MSFCVPITNTGFDCFEFGILIGIIFGGIITSVLIYCLKRYDNMQFQKRRIKDESL